MILKLYTWSLVSCLLILSNLFTEVHACERAEESYPLATGRKGQERLERIEDTYGHFSQSFLESLSPLPENAEILSVGCGTGVRECQMAQYWPSAHITAVDNKEDQLELAREKASSLGLTNIDFIICDANNLTYSNCYDLVYARLLLMHVRDSRSVLSKMIDAAKPGAPILCEELSSSSFYCQPSNKFYEEALQLTQAVANKMGVDYDIGVKLEGVMREQGLIFVQLRGQQPDTSNINVKMQLALSIEEAKPKLIAVNFDEKVLDDLLGGLKEFAHQETSRISMSDLFQVVGYKSH